MLETLFGLSIGITLADVCALTALTTVIVEVLKNALPKKFPTKALTVVIALAITITLGITSFGYAASTIILCALAGFIVAFISMNGFDSLKEIWKRFSVDKIAESLMSEDENTDDEEDIEIGEYSEGENEVLEEDEVEGEG